MASLFKYFFFYQVRFYKNYTMAHKMPERQTNLGFINIIYTTSSLGGDVYQSIGA